MKNPLKNKPNSSFKHKAFTTLMKTLKYLEVGFRFAALKFHTAIKRKWVRYPLMVLGSLFFLFSLFFLSIYLGLWGKLPTKYELTHLEQSLATQLVDRNGENIGNYYIFDRRPIGFKEIPPHLKDALIATEDARFYKHDGVDKLSLMRVFFKTLLMQDESSGGGSTLTQQLVKNIYGRPDSGTLGLVVSKFKEFIVAQRIEQVYSKEEIINLYLNTVPFPDNTYGIESASQKFFNKSTELLTLNEAAILVGTLKANNSYNPRVHPDRAKKRRDVVINQMLRYKYLKPQDTIGMERDTIVLSYQERSDLGIAPYFRELIRKEARELLKNYSKEDGTSYDLYQDGLTIHTTLDKKMQQYAEASMREHMAALQTQYEKAYGNYAPWRQRSILQPSLARLPYYQKLIKDSITGQALEDSLDVKKERFIFDWNTDERSQQISVRDSLSHYLSLLNCGFIAMDPQTGGILAYVGGIDFENFKYDHVSQSERMVGSTFKPFVYTTALEQQMDPCTYYNGAKEIYHFNGKTWSPSNSGGEGEDLQYSLKGALSNSINTVAVKVLLDVGIGKVITQAKRMGIESKLPYVPSLALGTAQIKMRDLASAYTAFVNQGKPAKPYYITKIVDRSGRVIAKFDPDIAEKPVMRSSTRQAMIEMMKATVSEGTATRLRYTYKLKNDIAGKTGTTQDNKDGWFVGITPGMVAVTWVGNDDYRIGFSSTGLGAGANSALPIYAKLMQRLNADTTYASITQQKFRSPSAEVANALNCAPIVRDSTSRVQSFFESIFNGEEESFTKEVYLDDRGKILKTVKQPVETEVETKEEDEEDNNGGFFSFLKRKKKKDDNE
ncbi:MULTISPECIES: PBP1A family penicillin-binding protein [unclassified Leeuwenhoekiella]|uniref:PBP1A family penicillin-binding protein n=2 Tax=unclassified Leeuwenhoekiella TaxID=2615029 RepID=UPI000C54EB14|nr:MULTISPECIES: PBP1A family penicillin-binding protein [unclassified Leeuwenhoekiella]MAW95029.1 penicillin-binding protein [Leeuwenhoekiella sp.]MBA79749.1 penicillin-binding protein [Leeuwenhoekiella sp.]|tara:strand:+ start:18963 stop:21473 length:2511 start_codon:yes stop_codon:yes gene_type:complete